MSAPSLLKVLEDATLQPRRKGLRVGGEQEEVGGRRGEQGSQRHQPHAHPPAAASLQHHTPRKHPSQD
ncbi:hypothetical protein E2C01_000782 [Portunus trituberculatus]|uniref:Uncharacterized protein n=1 Tax=Portunus trituberculatus TaxID=210409 RepID=A0A5B7CFZ0_PORTR|nr:hypothetical protein [Portunus trituberculatus]